MHAYLRNVLLIMLLCLSGIIAWFLLRSTNWDGPLEVPIIDMAARDGPRIDPEVKAKFDRITLGMSLKAVEAIMGPAGPSYSSQIERKYYIWKDRKVWVCVIVEQDKVTDRQIQLGPSVDD